MEKRNVLPGFFAVVILLLSACAPAAPVQSAQPPFTINASGTGKVYLSPDIAYITIGAHTEADTVSEALRKNNDQAQALSKTLVDMGVDARDIQTSAFSVAPQQQFDPQGQPTKTTYLVDNTVYITVRNLSGLGKLLDAAVSSGANRVNSLSFDVRDKTKSLAEARQLAVADARAQAKELADAAGVKLGRLTNLNASVSNVGLPLYDAKVPQLAAGGAANVPVSAGQMLVQVDVSLAYEIQQ